MRGFADLPPELKAHALRFTAAYLEGHKPAIAAWYASKAGMLVDHCLREIGQTEHENNLQFWMLQGAIWQTMRRISKAEKARVPRNLNDGLDWLIGKLMENADRYAAQMLVATR
jgi:hypothetical protein